MLLVCVHSLKIKLTFWMTALSATNKFAIICSILNLVQLILVMNFYVEFGFVLTDEFCIFFSSQISTECGKIADRHFSFKRCFSTRKKRLLDDFILFFFRWAKIISIVHPNVYGLYDVKTNTTVNMNSDKLNRIWCDDVRTCMYRVYLCCLYSS